MSGWNVGKIVLSAGSLVAALGLWACHSAGTNSAQNPNGYPGRPPAGVSGYPSDGIAGANSSGPQTGYGLNAPGSGLPQYTVDGRWVVTPFVDGATSVELTLQGRALYDGADLANIRPDSFDSGFKNNLSDDGQMTLGWSKRAFREQDAVPAPRWVTQPCGVRQDGELWVIERRTTLDGPRWDRPGTGTMIACQTSEPDPSGLTTSVLATTVVPVPLKHTDVQASVVGTTGAVRVTQQFQNPFCEKIEAVYVFPLPENSAISDFVMTIGGRTIRGVIREREEAQRIYTQARSQGLHAALLSQERDNIFTQRVANIEPGKGIDVTITYYQTLAYVDGWYEWVFPMVVGPRFNPPGTNDGVGAVPRGKMGTSGQPVDVAYLAPSERSGADIAVSLTVDAGVAIEDWECRSHKVNVSRNGQTQLCVDLSRHDKIPNKDMVFRWQVGAGDIKSGMIVRRGEGGREGYFSLVLVPPVSTERLARRPVEMVFVVDKSGSMAGTPIAQARDAVRAGLRRLRPGDTFQVLDFAENVSAFGTRPVVANDENIRRAMAWVNGIEANGGTYMITGLRAALDFPHDEGRTRIVAFLTDGFIGNEAEILTNMCQYLGESRVFAFGVGSSVNRMLMDKMAKLGRGAVAYVGVNEPGEEAMNLFMDRIEKPALTDLRVDWGGATVSDVYPSRLPDLFAGRSVVITGRISGDFRSPIRVSGATGTERRTLEMRPERATIATGRQAEATRAIWARAKIAELGDRLFVEGAQLSPQIQRTALENNLVSAYTSFVAVDSMVQTAGTSGVTVSVPVPMAEGVRYDTTVPTTGGVGRGDAVGGRP